MDNEERGDGLHHAPSETDGVTEPPGPVDADPVPEPYAVAEPALVEPEPTQPVDPIDPDLIEPDLIEPYADEPTVANALFAPPSPAAVTFAPVASGDIDVEADEEDDEEERKGISFATKALVVGAAWVLLVLFLIGRFEGDDDAGLDPVGLDQTEESAGGTELAAGEEGGEEEPVDLDGDGEIEPGEPGFGTPGSVEGASSGGSSGGSGGTSGGGTGGPTGGGGGSGDGTSDDAAPVTLPGGAPAPTSTTTTTKPGGGSTSTTTTTKPGGGSTSTTAPTTTTTASQGGLAHVSITGNCKFDKSTLSISRGTTVRFTNNSDNDVKLRFSSSDKPSVDAGDHHERVYGTAGVFNVGCERSGIQDTIAITVT